MFFFRFVLLLCFVLFVSYFPFILFPFILTAGPLQLARFYDKRISSNVYVTLAHSSTVHALREYSNKVTIKTIAESRANLRVLARVCHV